MKVSRRNSSPGPPQPSGGSLPAAPEILSDFP